MFTGIIESLGKVESLQNVGGDVRLRIQTDLDMSDVHLGDSIATNGICLTVIDWGENWYAADVSRESAILDTHFSRHSPAFHQIAML